MPARCPSAASKGERRLGPLARFPFDRIGIAISICTRLHRTEDSRMGEGGLLPSRRSCGSAHLASACTLLRRIAAGTYPHGGVRSDAR